MRAGFALVSAAALAAVVSSAAPAAAESWPSHPVRIINTFAPGGAADILARMAADQLTKALGQQFYVETRDGAGGVIGVDLVAHSAPDGYNFVITTLSLTAINPLINSKIGYDPFKDLTHVAYLAGSPIVFIVSAKSDVRTLADFIAKAKASSKPLTYGVSGFASAGQMVTESFAQEAGLKFQVVPYKGAAQSQLDVVAGNIDFATPTVTSASAQLQGGTVIALAQTGGARLPDYPNVPTFKELGYKLDATNWFGLAGPAGLPDDVVQKVNRAINAGMALPANQDRILKEGMLVSPMDAETFNAFVEHEALRWKPVILKAGLKME
ncbi:MAG TPA: tripartite tricarboxylate transporter substrate binding protein [Xanthobacteraceae bacterium]|jgi:tripartite-type tricarboxylate transporter receptor subunit TctC|nr:tripartite tricarboxylate transporter substrate binding protein [Xanthobacteraceae bacterium]